MSECEHEWIDSGTGLELCGKCWRYKTPPVDLKPVTYNRDPWEKLYSEKEELQKLTATLMLELNAIRQELSKLHKYQGRVQSKCPHDEQLTSYPGKCVLCEVRIYQEGSALPRK